MPANPLRDTLLEPGSRSFRYLLIFFVCVQTLGPTVSLLVPVVLADQIKKELFLNETEYALMFTLLDCLPLLPVLFAGYFLDRNLSFGKWAVFYMLGSVIAELFVMLGVWGKFVIVVAIGRVLFSFTSCCIYLTQIVLLAKWLVGVQMGLGVGVLLCFTELTYKLSDWLLITILNHFGLPSALFSCVVVSVLATSATVAAAAIDGYATYKMRPSKSAKRVRRSRSHLDDVATAAPAPVLHVAGSTLGPDESDSQFPLHYTSSTATSSLSSFPTATSSMSSFAASHDGTTPYQPSQSPWTLPVMAGAGDGQPSILSSSLPLYHMAAPLSSPTMTTNSSTSYPLRNFAATPFHAFSTPASSATSQASFNFFPTPQPPSESAFPVSFDTNFTTNSQSAASLISNQPSPPIFPDMQIQDATATSSPPASQPTVLPPPSPVPHLSLPSEQQVLLHASASSLSSSSLDSPRPDQPLLSSPTQSPPSSLSPSFSSSLSPSDDSPRVVEPLLASTSSSLLPSSPLAASTDSPTTTSTAALLASAKSSSPSLPVRSRRSRTRITTARSSSSSSSSSSLVAMSQSSHSHRQLVMILLSSMLLLVVTNTLAKGPWQLRPTLFVTAATAPIVGLLLDRLGRSSVFVLAGAGLQAAAMVTLIVGTDNYDPSSGVLPAVAAGVLGLAWACIVCGGWESIALLVPVRWLGRVFASIAFLQRVVIALVPLCAFLSRTVFLGTYVTIGVCTVVATGLVVLLYFKKSILNMNSRGWESLNAEAQEDDGQTEFSYMLVDEI